MGVRARDGESQTAPGCCGRAGTARELFEDPTPDVLGDALTGVFDDEVKLSVGFGEGGGQVNGCCSVPKRVRDEVQQNSPKDGRVGIQLEAGVDCHGDLRALVWRDLGERLLHELMDAPPLTPYRHGLCAES